MLYGKRSDPVGTVTLLGSINHVVSYEYLLVAKVLRVSSITVDVILAVSRARGCDLCLVDSG